MRKEMIEVTEEVSIGNGIILEKGDRIQLVKESDDSFNYQMLDRLRSDCDYVLGAGGRGAISQMWAKDVDAQIAKMRGIYNQLREKPEWLTSEDIDEYEVKLKQIERS